MSEICCGCLKLGHATIHISNHVFSTDVIANQNHTKPKMRESRNRGPEVNRSTASSRNPPINFYAVGENVPINPVNR